MFKWINDSLVKLVGDPHLGKEFVVGVPLERRGEREKSQFDQLDSELSELDFDHAKAKTVIIMGDLFDKFVVPNHVLMNTFWILAAAAHENPDVQYIILQGNHDVSRDTDKISSFQILASMLAHLDDQIFFITDLTFFNLKEDNSTVLLVPYDAFKSTKDLVESHLHLYVGDQIAAAFGHWDVESFGGDDHNLIPLKQLADAHINEIFTGHIHTPNHFWYEDENKLSHSVTVVGSMQPYSHSEDPDGRIYITLSLDEVNQRLVEDPNAFKDKFLRVQLKDGEELPLDLKAQAVISQKVNENTADGLQVKMEVFSFNTLFDESMKANNVPDPIAQRVWNEYEELAGDAETA